MKIRPAFVASSAVLVMGCGGGTAADVPAKAPAAQETVIGEGGKAGEAAAGHKPMAELKRDFMGGCAAKVPNAPDYCECGWEQMTKLFTEAEMNSSGEDKGKLAQLRDRVEGSCKAKLPDEVVKGMFVQGCSSEEPARKGYCECMWGEFRKKFSSAEMTDDALAKSDRFNGAKRGAVKACGAKMPEEVARKGFFQGCLTDPSRQAFCECAWKAVRAQGSAAEIESGLVDPEVARGKIEKACKPHVGK